MEDTIYDFFYEVPRRIVPGLAVLIMYFHIEAQGAFHNHPRLFTPYVFAACAGAVAWILGMLVEALTLIPLIALGLLHLHVDGSQGNPPLGSRLRMIIQFVLDVPFDNQIQRSPNGNQSDPKTDDVLEHRQSLLRAAELTMFRGLAAIFWFSWFCRCNFSIEDFGGFRWSRYLLVGAVAFSFGWLALKFELRRIKFKTRN